jgi:zinc protease
MIGQRPAGPRPGWAARQLRALVILATLLGMASAPARAAVLGQREVLGNGMVLLTAEEHALPIVTITVLIQAGASLDPPDKPGVANLTAELLMQGTPDRTASQISEAIEFVGGSLDVEAGRGVTTLSLHVLSKDLPLGLDLLSDVLLHPIFAPAEVQRKAHEVVAEIQHKHEGPGKVAAETFDALLFGSHPYARPVEGTEASVPTITRDDLVRFHAAFYRPNRAILAAVGDVSAPELKQLLAARLGGWHPGGPPIQPVPAPTPPAQPVVRTIQREVTQANIMLGHLGVRRDNPDYYAILVMNQILGGGFNSRLTGTIREAKGWAYDVRSVFDSERYAGTFRVRLQTKNETAQAAIEAVLAEIRRIRDHGVSATELADARAYLTGSFPLRLDTSSKVARLLANVEYYGLGMDYADRFSDLINRVSAADVQRVAQQYLHPDRYVLAVVADLTRAEIKE